MTDHECKTIVELLVDYSDGELSEADAQRVAAHLAGCPRCRSELRLLERSLELARSAWQESAARAPLPGTRHARPGGRRLRTAAAWAACALLLVAGGWLWWRVGPGSRADQAKLAAHVQPGRQTEEPRAGAPGEEMDVEAIIARAGRAARLAASVDFLAEQPGLEQYRKQAERYLADAYLGATAEDRRTRQTVPIPTKEPES